MIMQLDIDNPQGRSRTRLKPEERRRLIVEAAFQAVANEGFEGFRTRDIAASIGINSATLHHYFATKQDLIDAVADHLEQRLHAEHAPEPAQEVSGPDPFGRQFEDLIYYQSKSPDILAVYREFVARAPRDPAISKLVSKITADWKSTIVAALTQAKAQNSLRRDIDVDAVAGLVLSTAWGLVSNIFSNTTTVEAAARQLRALVSAPEDQ